MTTVSTTTRDLPAKAEDRLRLVHQEPTGQVRLVEVEPRYQAVMTAHFGQRFLEYRRAWAQSADFKHLPSFPLSLDLEVNASCNLKCVMCVLGGRTFPGRSGQPRLMDRSLYRRLMGQAEAHHLPAMTFGFLSEPLLRPDLADLISLARQAGVMDIRLGTNGLLLTKGVSQGLIAAGLTRLEVSVDAYQPETYRLIRRGGRLEDLMKNILEFLDLREKSSSGFPILRLSFLRLPANEHELADFIDFWRDKADLFSIQEPIFFEDAPISQEVNLLPADDCRPFSCAQPWQRLIVRANGDVLPCCSIYGLDLKIGAAHNQPLVELWRLPAMTTLRRLHQEGRVDDNRICRHCRRRTGLAARPKSEVA